MIHAAPSAPPAFAWDEWYAAGGRTIRIEEAADYMRKIREAQERRFTDPVAPGHQARGTRPIAGLLVPPSSTQSVTAT
jgi:hypothetical protein